MPVKSRTKTRKSKDPCAALKRKLQERDAELKEAREHQAAVSDILRAMSGTATDAKPVLQSMAEHAMRLCGSHDARIWLVEGDKVRYVTGCGSLPPAKEGETLLIDRRSGQGRAIVDRKAIHIKDAATVSHKEFPTVREFQRRHGHRTALAVPLMHNKRAVGLIALRKMVVEPFTKRQIELVQTFADQAAIAIENVRLYNEAQAKNAELTESLEQQTATSEILRIISSSPTDTQPVFDAIARSGVSLFKGLNVAIRLVNGSRLEQVASTLAVDRYANPLGDESFPASRVVMRRETLNIADVFAETWINEGAKRRAKRRGNHALAFAPMLRGNQAIGTINVSRAAPGLFTDKEIALLQTFADQAVIAIENVRLFKELQAKNADLMEALEQQTATSEILRVISGSPTDVQPVFDTILLNATRLCEAYRGALNLYDGEKFTIVADKGATSAFAELRQNRTVRPGPFSAISQIAKEKCVLHIADLSQWVGYRKRDPLTVASVELDGTRTYLGVPLLKDGALIGALTFRRQEVKPFTDSQIALLKTFADQAVIAIENVRLFNETKEALEQQTATSDILKVISSSPTDIQPVFDAVAKSAAVLCSAEDCVIRLLEGDAHRAVAHYGATEVPAEPLRQGQISSRAMGERRTVHIHDARTEYPESHAARLGVRTILAVPLLREREAIGAILLRRQEVRPFSDKQIKLLETFADQAVIAIENVRLFKELQARNAEITEALEQQTATAEILKVISSSPTDLQPVFDAILENATQLCDAHMANLALYDGDTRRTVAQCGGSPEFAKWIMNRGPYRPAAGSDSERMIAEQRPIHVADLRDSSGYRNRTPGAVALVELGVARTYIAVPMLKERRVVGSIAVYRPEVRPFTQKQIDLVATFANQAVIAIENVRLFNETKEALEQQTATANVLKLISRTTFELQPVLDTLLRSASDLCNADHAIYFRVHPEVLRLEAWHNVPDEYVEYRKAHPLPLSQDIIAARAVLTREPALEEDLSAQVLTYDLRAAATLGDLRSALCVPVLREGDAIGVIGVFRREVRPFSEQNITLLKTFADQAVIAIENVRLFKELQARNAQITEALEQQTATAEILQVISGSPTDVKPVLDAVTHRAAQLCNAQDARLFLLDGNDLRNVAGFGEFEGTMEGRPFSGEHPMSRAMNKLSVVHIEDLAAALDEFPDSRAPQQRFGHRTTLAVPLVRENRALGAILIRRKEVRPFSQKQIDLVKTFADQAVIAIDNVRLFNETKEALEQQTATAEILKVISSSPTDTQPVFDAIVKTGVRLFGGLDVGLRLINGDQLQLAAGTSAFDADNVFLLPLDDRTAGSRAAIRREVINIPDYPMADWVTERNREWAKRRGFRAIVSAPMIRDGNAIGTITVTRATPGPFADKEVALLRTFADQAVIAIENVRLFNETKEALEQQTATADILRIISSSLTDTQPVFDAIVRNCGNLFEGGRIALWLISDGRLHARAITGAADSQVLGEELPLDRASAIGACVLDGRVIHLPDLEKGAEQYPRIRQLGLKWGYHSGIYAPLLREGRAVGGITVLRRESGAFDDKEVALLNTFADQAVIAIENVRLFNETKEALEQQTATAEILKVISSSPTDVQPVFDAIVQSGVRLFDGAAVAVALPAGDQIRAPAIAAGDPEREAAWKERFPFPFTRDYIHGAAILDCKPIDIPDAEQDAGDWKAGIKNFLASGYRAMTIMPMVRGGGAIGAISVLRLKPGPLSGKQMALLQTFADQAVIAIENVRLFKETKEALEQQTVISEILRIISGSPTDTQPVFDAIVTSGVQLFGGMDVSLRLMREHDSELVASTLSMRESGGFSAPRDDDSYPTTRAMVRGEVVQVPDIFATDWVHARVRRRAAQRGWRAIMVAPMLRDGKAIGTVNVNRAEPGPFTDKQIALLKTFADQAVIAIENVRLFKELQTRNAEVTEALEQQTATAEILRVISRSPTNTQPVFDALLASATRLCDAHMASLRLYQDGDFAVVAQHGVPPALSEWTADERHKYSPQPDGAVGRMIAERRPIHVLDRKESPTYLRGHPPTVALVDLGGARTFLAVPMLKDGNVIGGINVFRPVVKAFTQKQIDLLSTFADQAVIAIENVRLFKELQARNAEISEALERQTATADILKVISSSPTDIQPVLDAVAESAARLCDTDDVYIRRIDGDMTRIVAHVGTIPLSQEGQLRSLHLRTLIGAVAREGRTIHIPDVSDPSVRERFPDSLVNRGVGGTLLYVPLLREGKAIGVIVMRRREVRAFTEKQIELLETFAAQAVIAIENVRLFKELQARNAEITEALDQQTATSNVLKIISRSTFDLGPVLETLVENARKLCDADTATIARADKDGNYAPVAMSALDSKPDFLTYAQRHPIRPDRGTAVGRAVLDRHPVHIPDVVADPEYSRADLVEQRGFRSILAVPMLREGEPIGVFGLTRTREVRPFTDKQIELVTTFADQAVIAIENVRLFNEIQEKGRQLEVANKHKSQFLANMSHELRTPLNCINGFSEMLLARMFGDLNEKQEEFLRDINSSGEHLLSLINDVLDLSKIEAGHMELHVTAFDPQATMDNSVMLVKERAARRGIAVSLMVDEKLDRWVGDERKIRQVVLNLLSNAVKFTPEGGRIEVKARREGDNMVVAVRDTGIGIKPEDQTRIFEEFQQAGDDYTKKAEGTGLGLALSRKFVELHGGTITVESEVGKGSTFTFTIPEMEEVTA